MVAQRQSRSPSSCRRQRPRLRCRALGLLLALLPVGAVGAISGPDPARMAGTVADLAAGIGVRPAGSPAEARAAALIAARFRALGYSVVLQPVPLPQGRASANVVAFSGPGPARLVVGGHYDSHRRAPGADDNASGIAVILEVARLLAGRGLPVQFVAFGAEEIIGRQRDHHHYGSRHYVRAAPPAFLEGLTGMLCVDAVGTGAQLRIEAMPGGDDRLARQCRALGWRLGLRPGRVRGTTLSDHEAFARAGVPVALFHRVPNGHMHTPGDTPGRVRPDYLRETALTLLAAIEALTSPGRTTAPAPAPPAATRRRPQSALPE
ncbi:MAG: M28 family peptidase [Armatimonadetes bacterium]|nr:M28 family peptidase [Armatimonadota bacterium]